MRPISLEISGFTSFRERVAVDFSRLGLFAITGQTGAGKTSLLDAMTWALYGKTARLGKAGRELVSQGAMSMEVLLRFRAGENEYRVLRRLKGSAPATVRLEYMPDGGEWEPITGNVRELEEQIRQLVGLDFDGFNKAVVLPQGQFDVFLRGKAEERRAVLSELLDISVYQRMMQSANEKARMEAALAAQKGLEIDDSVSAEALAERQKLLEAARQQEKALGASLKKLETVYDDAVELGHLRKDLGSSESSVLEIGKRAAETGRKRASAAEESEVLRRSLEELQGQVNAVAYDADEHLQLTGVLPGLLQRERYVVDLAAAEAASADLRARAEQAKAAFDEVVAAAAAETEALNAAREAYEQLHAMDRVTAFRSELKPGCVCPVCEQTVTTVPPVVDAKKLVAARKAMDKRTAAEETARKKLDKARTDAERAGRDLAAGEARVEELRKQLKALPAGAHDATAVKTRLGELDSAKRRRDELMRSLEEARGKLGEKDKLVVSLQAEAESLGKQIGEAQAKVESLRKQIDKAAAKIHKQFPEIAAGESESDWIRRRQTETRGALDTVRQQIGQLQAEIARLEEKLARNHQLRTEIAVHQREASEYKDLAQWLNAGNFQQFLLDAALDRLGSEGSKHLRTLSADRYEFGFRDKEFLVRDAWHGGEERSVSTLSGGESFLASLALALALAEGIAQLNSESGRVVLESLFLDEGFSTLDTETLSTVADALMMLQSGDRLIGIITHVAGLADQMPARIEVEKTVAGSRVTTQGQSSWSAASA